MAISMPMFSFPRQSSNTGFDMQFFNPALGSVADAFTAYPQNLQNAMGQIGSTLGQNAGVQGMYSNLNAALEQQARQNAFQQKMMELAAQANDVSGQNASERMMAQMGLGGDISSRLQSERFQGLGGLIGGPLTNLLGTMMGGFRGMFGGGGGVGGPITGMTTLDAGGNTLGQVSLPGFGGGVGGGAGAGSGGITPARPGAPSGTPVQDNSFARKFTDLQQKMMLAEREQNWKRKIYGTKPLGRFGYQSPYTMGSQYA